MKKKRIGKPLNVATMSDHYISDGGDRFVVGPLNVMLETSADDAATLVKVACDTPLSDRGPVVVEVNANVGVARIVPLELKIQHLREAAAAEVSPEARALCGRNIEQVRRACSRSPKEVAIFLRHEDSSTDVMSVG